MILPAKFKNYIKEYCEEAKSKPQSLQETADLVDKLNYYKYDFENL